MNKDNSGTKFGSALEHLVVFEMFVEILANYTYIYSVMYSFTPSAELRYSFFLRDNSFGKSSP